EVATANKRVTVKGGKEFAFLENPKLKTEKFDREKTASADDFYRWSSLRTGYLARANRDAARRYDTYGTAYYGGSLWGPSWYGPGWYWDPWYTSYTWIPAGPLYSPFGWGFYSRGWGFGAPLYGYGYGYGYRRPHIGPGFGSRPGGWGRPVHPGF